jgi:cobalt-zinc-cadmium efflux system outer membrane protein
MLLACGAFLILAGVSAGAESLTLDNAIDIAIAGNKELQAARYSVDQARARLLQAGVLPNPRLELAKRDDRLFRNEGEYTASIGVSQQFPVTGRIARQRDVARVDVALALAEIGQAELKLAGDVASGFYRVLALNRQIEIRDRLIEVDLKLVKGTRNRFKAAEVSELDVNAAQLDLQRLNQERTLLLSQRTTQLAQLSQLLGSSAAQALELDDSLPATESLPALQESQQEALIWRPDLRFAQLNAERARADQALARSQRWEDWNVSLGVEQGRQVIDGGAPQRIGRTIGVTLSIPLPFFNGNQGRIAETLAAGNQAEARIEALRFSIRSEVAIAFGEAERLQRVLSGYQRNMLPLSERNVRLAQQGYDQGLVSIVEVVQAQRQQADLNSAYLNTLDQYLQASARLQSAAGSYLKARRSGLE